MNIARAIIAGGGTGGHLFPGITVAREIQRRNSSAEILFVGAERGIEARVVPQEGFPLKTLPLGGVKGKGWGTRAMNMWAAIEGIFSAKKILREFRPQIVIGVGGYASFPAVSAAILLGYPRMIMEQNALPGLANRTPRRVILDPKFRISPTFKMFQTAHRVPIIIFGTVGNGTPEYPSGVEARQVPADSAGRLQLDAVLQSLSKDGVTRVLVEGGPTIASALLAADLADEVVIGHGTASLSGKGRKPFGASGLEVLDDPSRWEPASKRAIGADTLTVHRRTGRFADGAKA